MCTFEHFCKAASKVPVVLQNMTNHGVTPLPKQVIGVISAAVCLQPLGSEQSSLPHSKSSDEKLSATSQLSEKFTLDLDYPLLGEEWKTRITDRLNFIRDVYAKD